jgi:hypothetical protein
MGYHAPKTEVVCKSYDPEKLMYHLPIGAHITFGVSSPRVRFLDV